MKKYTFRILFFSLLLLLIGCNDDEPTYEKKVMNNTELIKALKTKGFSFEGNLLVMNEKIAEMKSLDLSNSKLTNVSGLEIFSNLEEINLSNNNFGAQFDFTKLPQSIKKIDLSNNEIYDYQGLATVDFETADIKILREFESITLPASARFNMEVLPHYSKESKTTKLSMQNAKTGKAEPYTTLREIPDSELRKYFNEQFSSIMNSEGKVDISKKISTEQASTNIVFWSLDNIKDIEGIEYFVNNPMYMGTVLSIIASPSQEIKLAYLKPVKTIEFLMLQNVSSAIFDWSSAKHMHAVTIRKNDGLKEIDLSHSKYFMQREGDIGYNQGKWSPDFIDIYDCPELEQIKLPTSKNNFIAYASLYKLPKLTYLDVNKIGGIARLYLAELPNLKELELTSIKHVIDFEEGKIDQSNSKIAFSITEDILSIKGIKQFITEFGSKDKLSGWNQLENSLYEYNSPYKGKSYDYTQLYKVKTKAIGLVENREKVTSSEELLKEILKRQNKKK